MKDKTINPGKIIANPINIEEMIYVPSVNLHFARQRTCLGKTWGEAKKSLKKQGLAMPTPHQFKEFLKLLVDHTIEFDNLDEEITEKRDPFRGEWLNARFEKKNNNLYMICEDALVNGNYTDFEMKLSNVLTQSKLRSGISLYDWLDSKNESGFPDPGVGFGYLNYFSPFADSVAGIYAYFGRVFLTGWLDLLRSHNDSFGVFACAPGNKKVSSDAGRK